MQKNRINIILTVLLVWVVILSVVYQVAGSPGQAMASSIVFAEEGEATSDDASNEGQYIRYKNPDTGYVVAIEDGEDLLTAIEEQNLVEDMKPITEYGNASFVSCYAFEQSTDSFASDWYYSHFGNDSGTAFVIDMYNRNIYIVSAGYAYKIITKGYANTITDNVYRYASRGQYYECAAQAFGQASILLDGGKIARPMKHITNALVAVILAVLVNYILAMRQRTAKETPALATFAATTYSTLASDVLETKRIKSVVYSESSSGGGGSSGGGFSGGGGGGFSGGGGGFSGGGGGHSF